jgi:hypothetical protein
MTKMEYKLKDQIGKRIKSKMRSQEEKRLEY